MSPLEDSELWIQAVRQGWRFHNLARVTFEYRVRPNSLLARILHSKALEEDLHRKIKTKHADLYGLEAIPRRPPSTVSATRPVRPVAARPHEGLAGLARAGALRARRSSVA